MDEQRVAEIRERRERACGPGFASYSPDLHFGDPERAKDGRDLIDRDVPWLLDALAAREGEAKRWRALVVDAMKGLADSDDGDLFPLYLRLERALAAPPGDGGANE